VSSTAVSWQRLLTVEILQLHALTFYLHSLPCKIPRQFRNLTADSQLCLMLRPTVSRPVCLGIKHPSGAYEQVFITVRQLRVCCCGALSLTRGRVCSLQFLLALDRAVILCHIRDFPFRRLLRLAGLLWRYSTPPPHGRDSQLIGSPQCSSQPPLHGPSRKHRFQ
jgi:hypothetical protein